MDFILGQRGGGGGGDGDGVVGWEVSGDNKEGILWIG